MQPVRLPSFRHVLLLLGSSTWWGSLHPSARQAVPTTAAMLIGDAKRPQSMSFTGAPMASVLITTAVRSGWCPVRLKYAATTYATAAAESPGSISRGPQVQQRLGLITALTNRQSVPGIAPEIKQRDMGGEPWFQRDDPLQIEGLRLERQGADPVGYPVALVHAGF